MERTPFRILAIDGGGIKGIIPATILQTIQSKLDYPLYCYFDLIVGVSSGALTAYSIVTPRSSSGTSKTTPLFDIKDIVELYRKKSHEIFSTRTPDGINLGFTSAKYSSKGIESLLKDSFGERRISQCLTPTISVSYCTEHRRPIFFKSSLSHTKSHRDVKIWEACRASTAAPIYFPPFRLHVTPEDSASINFSLIDGGVACNNPSIIGIIESLRQAPSRPIHLISIGTGRTKKQISYSSIDDGGLKDWGSDIVDVLMGGQEDVSNQAVIAMLRSINNSQHVRIQMELPTELEPMDKAKNVESLFQLTTSFLKENREIIDKAINLIDIPYLNNKNKGHVT